MRDELSFCLGIFGRHQARQRSGRILLQHHRQVFNGFYDNTSGASNAHGCAGRSSHWYKAQPAVYSSPGQWSYSLGSNGSIPNTPEWTYEICCTNT